jgi:hypothetical protein
VRGITLKQLKVQLKDGSIKLNSFILKEKEYVNSTNDKAVTVKMNLNTAHRLGKTF